MEEEKLYQIKGANYVCYQIGPGDYVCLIHVDTLELCRFPKTIKARLVPQSVPKSDQNVREVSAKAVSARAVIHKFESKELLESLAVDEDD